VIRKLAGFLFCLLVLAAVPAWAAFGPVEKGPGAVSTPPEREPIRAIALLSGPAGGLAPGGEASLVMVIGVNPGFHLNSDKPPLDWLSPTRLELKPHPFLKVTQVRFPEPRPVKLGFSEELLPVFDKMVMVGLTLVAAEEAPPGPTILEGTLFFQACTDQACLPPDQKEFKLELAVGPAGEPSPELKPRPAPAPALPQGFSSGPGRDQAPGSSRDSRLPKSLWLLLLTTFFGGLALNLTPCVYPLIPITVAYFGGQTKVRSGMLAHGALYLAGIAATYTALGTTAALTGRLLGAALQHPLTLILVAGLLIVLAGSMLGLFELRLPGFLSRMANLGSGRRGLAGSLIMGLTLGLVAAPCIGPFVLGVLTLVARAGDPVLGAGIFLSLSLGLGLPLAVLGLFANRLISLLPSSGPWLVWVRRLLGAVLILMAAYLLRPLLGEEAWAWAMAGAALFGACLAIFSGAEIRLWLRVAVMAGWVGLAVFQLQALSVPEAEWETFSPAKLAAASGRPVVLDFMADWCAPCRELAQNLAHPQVRALTRGMATFKVDLTDWDSQEAEALRRRFGIKGVPTLVLLGPDGREKEELRVIGVVGVEELKRRFRRLKELGGKDQTGSGLTRKAE